MKKLHRTILYFSLFCLALNIYNNFVFQNLYPSYLLWNLFLAGIPYLVTIYLGTTIKNKKKKWKYIQGLLIFLWLIFFPNTIYLVTDFIHLYEQTYLPVWFDIAQIFSLTFIAFLLGFLSMFKIEKFLAKKCNPTHSLIFVISAIVLANIGVYMGRNLRWNSWDLLIQPWQVIAHTFNILSNLNNFLDFISMVLIFSGMFAGVYFCFRSLLQTKEKEV